jgi:hypothetical protein
MTDSLFQRLGDMSMPTKATDVDPTILTLAPLDPARDTMLALFAAACNFELGPAWAVANAGTPLAGQSVVQDTWPGQPSAEVVRQRAGSFPMLFLSRDSGKYDDFSLARKQLTQTWGLHYIMSPIDVGDTRKLQDILVRVGATIMATIERKGHPAYQNGDAVLWSVYLATLNITSAVVGQAKFADGAKDAPLYHSLSMELVSTEIVEPLQGTAAPWLGTGYSVSTGNADGMIQPFVQFDSEAYAPQLAPWAVDSIPPATQGNIQVDTGTGNIQVDPSTGTIQVGL